jgi:hypothetical protein
MPIKKSVRIIKKVRDEDGQWRFVCKRQTKCMDDVFAAQAAGVRSAMR